MFCEQPIFIVGAGSSGTTLLGVMLDRHSEVACGPEVYLFDKADLYGDYNLVKPRMTEWARDGLVGDGQIHTPNFLFNREAYFCDDERLAGLVAESQDLRGFCDGFFGHFLEQRKKKIWAEKTGSNAYCMNEIFGVYPEARVVHLVRDGRDVACSMKKRCGSMYHSASHWLYNVSAAVRWRGDERYLEVRYEDLVADPQTVLEVICHHVGIDFEHQMLGEDHTQEDSGKREKMDAYWEGQRGGNIHATWTQSPFKGGISTKSVGRYLRDMTEDDAALFWHVVLTHRGQEKLCVGHHSMGELMLMFGYDCTQAHEVGAVPIGSYREAFDLYRRRSQLEKQAGRGYWKPLTRLAFSGVPKLLRSDRSCAA